MIPHRIHNKSKRPLQPQRYEQEITRTAIVETAVVIVLTILVAAVVYFLVR